MCYIYITVFFFIELVNGIDEEVGFSNQWTVEISGGDFIANEIALKCGLINHGKVSITSFR